MEKLFSPNKWFVIFCGLLIVVWALLQFVGNARLVETARGTAQDIFSWAWPEQEVSMASVTDATVLKKSDTDAVVSVKLRQTIKPYVATNENLNEKKDIECGATLTFYRASNNWVLGKVELQ